jgi:hypothetical protein
MKGRRRRLNNACRDKAGKKEQRSKFSIQMKKHHAIGECPNPLIALKNAYLDRIITIKTKLSTPYSGQ